jgi:hypothetical protein
MSDVEELKKMTRETYNEYVRQGIAAGRRPNDHWEPSPFRDAIRIRLQEFAVANRPTFERLGLREIPLYNQLDMMAYYQDNVNVITEYMDQNRFPDELKRAVYQLILRGLRDVGIARIDPSKPGEVAAGKIKALSKQGLALPEDLEKSVVGMLTGKEETSADLVARRAKMLGRPAPAPPGGVGPAAAGAGGPAGGRRKSTGVSGRRKKTRKVRSGRSRSTGSRSSRRRS